MSTADARIAGVLLAAGTSSRFGDENKLLVDIDGIPIVRHAANTLVGSGVDPVVAVVGCDADAVAAALDGLPIELVENPEFATGQASSVRTGVATIADRSDAVVIALGDMPHVSIESIEKLLDAYREGRGDALAVAYNGERGNPVLFDQRWYDQLQHIDGDVGGRGILQEWGTLIETRDPGVRYDIDRPDDISDHRDAGV